MHIPSQYRMYNSHREFSIKIELERMTVEKKMMKKKKKNEIYIYEDERNNEAFI